MDLSSYVPQKQYGYYFEQCDATEQKAYDALLDGYLKQKKEIRVWVVNSDSLWKIHQAICYDVPEVFFVKNVQASMNPVLGITTLYPEYRFDDKKRADILAEMESSIDVFVRRIKMLSEHEKVKQIHDFLIRSVTYKDVDAPYSHEAPGALLYGIAVCEGISKAFKYISDRAGIKAIVAVGKSSSTDNDSGHAWNIVYVDNLAYHLDVTFDYSMSKDSVARYDYYLLSDTQIKADHMFSRLPECSTDFEYYEQIGCFAPNKKTLRRLIADKLKPGKPFVFKTPVLSGNKEEIVHAITSTISAFVPFPYALGRSISISYNWERMIFEVQLQ